MNHNQIITFEFLSGIPYKAVQSDFTLQISFVAHQHF